MNSFLFGIIALFNGSRFLLRRLYRGLPFDEEAFDKHIATLALKLDVYDKILSQQEYIAGNVRVHSIILTIVMNNAFMHLFLFVRKPH